MDYDLILIKDNDQRIVSFSWPTFIEKVSNAVMSGPFRRSASKYTNFQMLEASHYEGPTHTVVAMDVIYLEQYFVLMDGKFANFFFNLALREKCKL